MSKRNLRIGIMGSRGIPNEYGGFEQLTQFLSAGLHTKGHTVYVYNPHHHSYQKDNWSGVHIVHCYDPEKYIGMAGQFVYDLNCIRDARKRELDILLILGYTTSSVWGWYYPASAICINHMDGLEWKRRKYGFLTRQFLKLAERLAVHYSQYHIADSPVIASYLGQKYNITANYIAYGAGLLPVDASDRSAETTPVPFYLIIARLEKENNIEMILDGFCLAKTEHNCVVVGNTATSYGRRLTGKYAQESRIQFIGSQYDQSVTERLKITCSLYFHGHCVGGTNPSLLEAMASGTVVCAHDNPFNRAVLCDNGFYFSSSEEVCKLMEMQIPDTIRRSLGAQNRAEVLSRFHWPDIINQYETLLISCYAQQSIAPSLAF